METKKRNIVNAKMFMRRKRKDLMYFVKQDI